MLIGQTPTQFVLCSMCTLVKLTNCKVLLLVLNAQIVFDSHGEPCLFVIILWITKSIMYQNRILRILEQIPILKNFKQIYTVVGDGLNQLARNQLYKLWERKMIPYDTKRIFLVRKFRSDNCERKQICRVDALLSNF